jgi:hypothetical protein
MKIPKKRCEYCSRWFEPYPPKQDLQRFCSRRACQRERHRQACLAFYRDDPHCDDERREKIRAWAQRYPDYWRKYREAHGGYRQRERRRMRVKRRRAGNVAKRDAWKEKAVEKLRDIQAQAPEFVAKRDACDRRVDAVLAYLVWKETPQNETLAQAAAL